MEYIQLMNSILNVSRLCIGGDPMGGYGWGQVNDKELVESIYTSIDSGINFFDTADVYGLGKAEMLLGKTLKKVRDKVVIATKFGVRRTSDNSKSYYDNSPTWIRQALEGSLERLGTDYIDIYQLHWRDGKTPISVVVEQLEKLKEKGLIRYYGLSNITISDLNELIPYKEEICEFSRSI